MNNVNQITVSYNGKTISVNKGTALTDIITENGVVAVKVNNQVVPLSYSLNMNCTIEPLTAADPFGMTVYRRSLTFLLAKVVSELFPQCRLHIGHSLGPGYYFDIGGQTLTQEDLNIIHNEMISQVEADKPIVMDYIAYCEAIDALTKAGKTDKIKLLSGINTPRIAVWRCDNYMEIFDGPLTVRTGILKVFNLFLYKEGLIIQFPRKSDPSKPAVFTPQDRLFEVYRRSRQITHTLQADNIGDLNNLIMTSQMAEFIQLSENVQLQNIYNLAHDIQSRSDVKLIAIAGPSSSGKTTFSKKLSLQLKTLGLTPVTISVDDYFIDRAKTPRGADGQPDYECLEALDVDALNDHLLSLMHGKETHLLHYDFMTGLSSVREDSVRLGKNEILVIEGIHCLNDALTHAIPAEMKYKIYISALTQINIDDNNRIPTTDNRLLRRIIRDYKYRGHSAKNTLSMWPNVRAGEEKYIFPFQNQADGYFNSALNYELAILKPYAEPLLRQIKPSDKEYADAIRLLRLLNYILAADDDEVPADSIVREFIGGSFFKY